MERARYWSRSLLLTIAGGALAGICWLPTALAPLFPVAWAISISGLQGAQSPRGAVRFGFWQGVARYAVASHFLLALLRYSPVAIAFYLLAILFIVPFALLESCGSVYLEQRFRFPRGVAFALFYVLGEKLRTLGDLSFPADLLSHACGKTPVLLATASMLGPYAVTAGVTLLGALIEARYRRGLKRQAVAIALLLPAIAIAEQLYRSTVTGAEGGLRLAVVQPCATAEQKMPSADPAVRERHLDELWSSLRRLTLEAAPNVDLIVWPETARPDKLFFDAREPFHDPEVEALAKQAGVPILYGLELVEVRDRQVLHLYNGAALAWPDGRAGQWYGKQRLLPFAEGMPFGALYGWDPGARARKGRTGYLTLLGNFSAGPEPTIFEIGKAKIGVLICYEGMYPQLAREYKLRGANLLAAITNDDWWGHSIFPAWHAQMVSARATENDLPVVRAANNGVSSITSAGGVTLVRSRLDDATVLRGNVQLSGSGPTFYSRHGDLLIGAIVLLFAGWPVAARRIRR